MCSDNGFGFCSITSALLYRFQKRSLGSERKTRISVDKCPRTEVKLEFGLPDCIHTVWRLNVRWDALSDSTRLSDVLSEAFEIAADQALYENKRLNDLQKRVIKMFPLQTATGVQKRGNLKYSNLRRERESSGDIEDTNFSLLEIVQERNFQS